MTQTCNTANPFPPSSDSPLSAIVGDYHAALIDILIARTQQDPPQRPRLLFASVRLIPDGEELLPEIPVAKTDGHLKLPGGTQAWHRRAVCRAEEATQWYLSLGCGDGTASIPTVQLDKPGLAAHRLTVYHGVIEPPWPTFATVASTIDSPLSFVGAVPAGARISTRACTEPDNAIDGISASAWSNLCEWALLRCGVDLERYPDLAGCVYLVLPNPLLRSVDVFFPSDNLMAVHLRPRFGRSIAGLSVGVFEERFGYHTELVWREIGSPLTTVVWNRSLRETGMVLVCNQRGSLYSHPPVSRIRSISIAMDIALGTRVVTAPGRSLSSAPVTYQIQTVSEGRLTHVGEPIPDPEQFLVSRYFRWKRNASVNRPPQKMIFYDQVEDAASWIRAEIATATKTVRMIDPYFSAVDVAHFCPAVRRRNVTVECLLSRARLTPGGKGDALQHVRRLVELQEMISQIRVQDSSLTIHARVLSSDTVHDRFLCVDERIWVLGASYNSFGGALTTATLHETSSRLAGLLAEIWAGGIELETAIVQIRKENGE